MRLRSLIGALALVAGLNMVVCDALAFGAFLSILVGGGLMALIFYSSRKGYDEPPHKIEPPEGEA